MAKATKGNRNYTICSKVHKNFPIYNQVLCKTFCNLVRLSTIYTQETFCNSPSVNKMGYFCVLSGFLLGISQIGKVIPKPILGQEFQKNSPILGFTCPNDFPILGFTRPNNFLILGFTRPNNFAILGFIRPNNSSILGFTCPNNSPILGFARPNNSLILGFAHPSNSP